VNAPAALEAVDLVGGGTVEYQGSQYLDRTDDERVRQSPFFRFGANVGFGNASQGWSARLVGQNLGDVDTDVHLRDVPLGGGNFAAIPEPQRLIMGSIQWSF
ncbi:MAG: hypothetical protein ACREQQ_00910, partial [Candidatus Binatia bacterium]